MGEIVDELTPKWAFTLSNANATGFRVVATGVAADVAGLTVRADYDRTNPNQSVTWIDN